MAKQKSPLKRKINALTGKKKAGRGVRLAFVVFHFHKGRASSMASSSSIMLYFNTSSSDSRDPSKNRLIFAHSPPPCFFFGLPHVRGGQSLKQYATSSTVKYGACVWNSSPFASFTIASPLPRNSSPPLWSSITTESRTAATDRQTRAGIFARIKPDNILNCWALRCDYEVNPGGAS